MSTIVSFKDVSLNFGGVKALNSVSFDIKEGSLHAIIGPNGAGKTSIFNCISGIYRPTNGSVTYGEQDIKDLRPDEVADLGIARTFQNIELDHHKVPILCLMILHIVPNLQQILPYSLDVKT